MMRTASVRSMYMTASKRRRSEMPSNTNRSSTAEWRGSATILPNGSPKTVAASSNDTPCLARFPAAFRGSHSNSSANPHYTCGSKMVLRHRPVGSFTGTRPHCPAGGRLDNRVGNASRLVTAEAHGFVRIARHSYKAETICSAAPICNEPQRQNRHPGKASASRLHRRP